MRRPHPISERNGRRTPLRYAARGVIGWAFVSVVAAFVSAPSVVFAQQASPAFVNVEATPFPPATTVDLLPITVPRLVLRSTAEWDSDASRTARRTTTGEDPVISLRAPRIIISTMATLTAGGLTAGLGGLLGAALGSSGGTTPTVMAVLGGVTWLVGAPAFYSWTGSFIGGNGRYLGALAGTGAATLVSLVALIPILASRSNGGTAVWAVLSPIALITGLIVGYELSTTTRTASSQQARTNTRRNLSIPGFSLTESYQGVTLSGLF